MNLNATSIQKPSIQKPQATRLRCEYLESPLAIDARQPRLSWEMESPAKGAYQRAYQVLMADNREALRLHDGNLWDSGKVVSNQSRHIHYAGTPLHSSQQVFWKVLLWDEHGMPGCWSPIATFTMGLLDSNDWQGDWIGNYLGITQSSPLLRKEFRVEKRIKRALLYATACRH